MHQPNQTALKKIHLLVLKSYLGPLVLTFFIALFILLMQFVWKYVDDLVGKGLEWYVVGELLLYASTTFVPLALPLAILLSSIMTFGNLGEHYELVAMKSAGISLGRIMLPLIFLSVLISIGAFFFSNMALPVANLKSKSLLYDIRKQKLALNIQPGIFYNGIDNYVLRVGSKDDEANTLYDVMVYDHSDQMGNMKLTTAERGVMRLTPDESFLVLTLHNGYNYAEQFDERSYRSRRQFQTISFTQNQRKFDLLGFGMQRTNEDLFRSNYHMMNMDQLETTIDSLQREYLQRVNDLGKAMVNRYTFLQHVDTAHRPADTLSAGGSFFSRLSRKERERVLATALQNARNAKEYVSNSMLDHRQRTTMIKRHSVVWHQKLTLSVACLLFFFIGAPLGAIIRKGGLGMPVVMSAFIFVLFHIITITGEKYAVTGAAPVAQSMWIGPAVLLPLGLWLTYKSSTDSPLLDTDTYIFLLNRIIPARYRLKYKSDKNNPQ